MNGNTLGYGAAIAALVIGLSGAVLLTELGQLMNLPRDWVFGYFHWRVPLSIAALALAGLVVFRQLRTRLLSRWMHISFIVVLLGSLFVVNYFVPYFWLRSEQLNATFISISEADELLEEDEDVLVLEINGDARAYPREWMQLPHFAGHEVGGQQVVMSYCALSDLPQAFSTDFNGQPADYRVIAQVNNNLIFTDTESGELFQQITGRGEYSGMSPDGFPVQRMPWGSFKQLYPEGLVFFTQPNWLDRITQVIFDAGLVAHYEGKPLFPTLTMDDDRLPGGEPVWGMEVNGEAMAVARSAFDEGNSHTVSLGGEDILVIWYPEYQTMGAFYEPTGEDLDPAVVDPYGNTPDGKLQRVHLYPGVRWMVWSHWFPDTPVLK